mmetsp:Transcript_5852/g.10441  ORF Transcript_5852/g.10441 Transcript_5852/m.10441 type:complete len:223 (-) Transcript_5852:186-854(-)
MLLSLILSVARMCDHIATFWPLIIIVINLTDHPTIFGKDQYRCIQPNPFTPAAPLIHDPNFIIAVIVHGRRQEHGHAWLQLNDGSQGPASDSVDALARLRRSALAASAQGSEAPLAIGHAVEGAQHYRLCFQSLQMITSHFFLGSRVHNARISMTHPLESAIVGIDCDDHAVADIGNLVELDGNQLVITISLACSVVAAVHDALCLCVVVPNDIKHRPVACP